MPGEDFEFPTTVPTLAKVPPQFRPCYRPTGFGGFTLTPEAGDALAVHLAEVATLETAHAAAMGAADRAIAERTDTLRGMVTRKAIGDAMDDAGVPGKLMSGAQALFSSTHEIEVDEPTEQGGERVVIVRDRFGLQSLDAAVRGWLASDEGKPYVPAPKFQGEFGEMISRLKAQR
ncbi:hypothetical protein NKI80_18865 [Mesorhizobium sp. M0387]|uniref:hypothetical protein n=1 Tax=Mesorhizobium sp. M0387 TaxID=2956940 RepID=UPI0033385479